MKPSFTISNDEIRGTFSVDTPNGRVTREGTADLHEAIRAAQSLLNADIHEDTAVYADDTTGQAVFVTLATLAELGLALLHCDEEEEEYAIGPWDEALSNGKAFALAAVTDEGEVLAVAHAIDSSLLDELDDLNDWKLYLIFGACDEGQRVSIEGLEPLSNDILTLWR